MSTNQTQYRLYQPISRGRLWVGNFIVLPGCEADPHLVWVHEAKKASLFTREQALEAASVLDAKFKRYRAGHSNPEIRDAPLRPLRVVPTSGGMHVERR